MRYELLGPSSRRAILLHDHEGLSPSNFKQAYCGRMEMELRYVDPANEIDRSSDHTHYNLFPDQSLKRSRTIAAAAVNRFCANPRQRCRADCACLRTQRCHVAWPRNTTVSAGRPADAARL